MGMGLSMSAISTNLPIDCGLILVSFASINPQSIGKLVEIADIERPINTAFPHFHCHCSCPLRYTVTTCRRVMYFSFKSTSPGDLCEAANRYSSVWEASHRRTRC